MAGRLSVWQIFEQVWCSIFRTLARFPLLALGGVLLYALLAAGWFQFSSFHLFNQLLLREAVYYLIHALAFTPLVVAAAALILFGKADSEDIWTRGAVAVGAVLLARDLVGMLLGRLPLLWYHYVTMNWPAPMHGYNFVATALFLLPEMLLNVAMFLLSVLMVPLLPLLASERPGWRVVPRAWTIMRGHFLFAVCAAFFASVPWWMVNHLLDRAYHALATDQSWTFSLTLRQWKILAVRGFQLELRYLLFAAVSAWVCRVIVARKVIAP